MAAIAELRVGALLTGADGHVQIPYDPDPFRWGPLVGKRESVSLTGGAFTALSPPSNTKAVIIILPSTAASLTLKGVTGDTGTTIVPSSNFIGIPLLIPLGSSPSIGILNSGSTVAVDLIWL